MFRAVYSNYPPSLSSEQEAYLVQVVKDWSIQHGLTVRPSPSIVSEEVNPKHVLATNAPVTLFPSPFPRKCFEQAQRLQSVYNELYAAISSDEVWLEEVMEEYGPLIADSLFLFPPLPLHSQPVPLKWFNNFSSLISLLDSHFSDMLVPDYSRWMTSWPISGKSTWRSKRRDTCRT